MAQIVYECLFLFDANKYVRDPGGVSTTVTDLIQKNGGEVLVSRLWKEDKLAYPVNGHRKGAYWLTYFRMESTTLSSFNRACGLNEDVLRHLVIKIDPRLVDTLVSHAKGESTADPEPTETAPAEDTPAETTEIPDSPFMIAAAPVASVPM